MTPGRGTSARCAARAAAVSVARPMTASTMRSRLTSGAVMRVLVVLPVLAVLLVLAVLGAAPARATPVIGAHDVATLFYVAKSDDRNRVDYGVRLDARCSPVGDAPVYAYWRRFEPGQQELGDLGPLDATAYGIAHQSVRVREPNGSWIELGLRAVPARRLLVLVQRHGDRCIGAVQTAIRGRDAVLDHVFVDLAGPLRVREVIIRGEDRVTGEPVFERARP